jgi:glycosyltransferase involved in cell wall biosynthesis
VSALRVLYVSSLDLLRRRRSTNRVSDMRLCQALALGGAEVEIVVPYAYRPDNIRRSQIRELFEVEEPVGVSILPTPLWEKPPGLVRVPVWSVALTLKYLAERARSGRAFRETVWVSRDHNSVATILRVGRLLGDQRASVVYWAHELQPRHRRIARIYRSADGILATNSAIVEDLETLVGVPADRTEITLNPVSSKLFDVPPDRAAARAALGLEAGERVAVYTGKVGPRLEELDLILETARLLPDYTFVVTGGAREAVEHFEGRCAELGIANVRFTGFLLDAADVRRYQQAADAVISYYTRSHKLVDYNYPHKVTEYMASGTPIVTPEFRATRDVLHPGNAHFVEPHDPSALAQGLRRVVEDPAYGRALAERALADGREATLERRGPVIVEFLRRIARRRSG